MKNELRELLEFLVFVVLCGITVAVSAGAASWAWHLVARWMS